MGRHSTDLRIALNACVLAVASCYAGHGQALPRPAGVPPPLHAIPSLDALAAAVAASIPDHERWKSPPLLDPASPSAEETAPAPEAVAPDSLLDERTPLRTNTGGRLQTVGPQSLDPVLKIMPGGPAAD